jgi:hypothetical protein
MSDEFNAVLNSMREAPIREQVEGLSDVIEKMMMLIMSIPDQVDTMVNGLQSQISGLQSKISGLESRIAAGGTAAPGVGAVPSPGGAVPGAPPPPPGAPAPRPQAPANPISLRSSIMGELKELFKKRRALSE